MTMFPNSLHHKSQDDAGLEVHQFFPLIKIQCSEYLKTFLCTVYAPPCKNKGASPISPCQSLCEKVKSDCEPLMNTFELEWPHSLNCENFQASEPCVRGELETSNVNEQSGSDIKREFSTNNPENPNKCEPITMPLCRDGLPYNMTMFPNSLRHKNQEDAALEVHSFYSLVKTECSKYLQVFLCTVYTPPCDNGNSAIILPCRALCVKARDSCLIALNENRFNWPHYLRCERFPESGDCFANTGSIETNTNHISPSPDVYEDIEENESEDNLFLNPYHESCEIITTEICMHDIPYNTTFFPNSQGHVTQSEAVAIVNSFFPLFSFNCSKNLRLFLCSVYVPPCTGNGDIILPCRSLCEAARDGCEKILIEFAFAWPACLKCGIFPESAPCLGENTTLTIEKSDLENEKTDGISNKGADKPICEVIDIPMCEDILAFNKTYFPNALGHENQNDARLSIQRFYPLVKTGCSKKMGSFLCSIHAPPCGNISNPMILPCRSLCEKARTECQNIMNRNWFVWPDDFHCDRLPENDLCIGHNAEEDTPVSVTTNMTTITAIGSEKIKLTKGNGDPRQFNEVANVKPCQKKQVPFCQGDLLYDMTKLPNSFGHSSQENAATEFLQFYPLIQSECSEHLKLFLCISFIPMCMNDTGATILPCRSVCDKAQEDCSNVMKNIGFSWPNRLRCDQFPTYGPCVGKRGVIEFSKDKEPEVKSKVEEYARKDLRSKNCRAITIPFCREILPYHQTSFPNAHGHSTQKEAFLQLKSFFSILKSKCSRNLKLFLCSVLIPPCKNSVIMLPCRSLCKIAKDRCRRNMDDFGFEWPGALQCDHFPQSGSCVREVEENGEEVDEIPELLTTAIPEELDNIVTEEDIGTEKKETDIPEQAITGKERQTLNPVEIDGTHHQCSNIQISLCRDGLSYNMTSFPNNLAGVATQKEASVQLQKFYPLVNDRCSKHIHLILCSIFAPKCTRDRQYVPPCKSLCRKARKECRETLKKHGIQWPGLLRCNKFTNDMPCLK